MLRPREARSLASNDGGAGILNDRGTLTLRDSVVTRSANLGTSNGADGGGISNTSTSATSTGRLTLVNSVVSGNTRRATAPGSSTTTSAR